MGGPPPRANGGWTPLPATCLVANCGAATSGPTPAHAVYLGELAPIVLVRLVRLVLLPTVPIVVAVRLAIVMFAFFLPPPNNLELAGHAVVGNLLCSIHSSRCWSALQSYRLACMSGSVVSCGFVELHHLL